MPDNLNPPTDIHALVQSLGEAARSASRVLAPAPTALKNQALEAAAEALGDREKTILAANAQDVKGARAEGARSRSSRTRSAR